MTHRPSTPIEEPVPVYQTAVHHGGPQRLYRFENGYGASVVCHQHSYGGPAGLFELAVTKWEGEEWTICCSTPITDDVLGWLEEDDVQTLRQIESLS